ncbi:hypothetical protein [Denitrobacterium detoxificans]|jgi:F0F1-type ATP synthase assembly protein I|uniref:hypothetical protein n=1 Tax=Denitrobacterium detoxificans TaxID=79604 RepID=UPI0026F0B325|nr:hypothetical protein [Denitrobacterium detoxificans]MBE6466179.1 hypothetical protein [Denitrobacterium detoxificans]
MAEQKNHQSAEQEKNPFALRRNLFAAATLAAFIAYFIVPDQLAKTIIMVVAIILVMAVTYFQQKHRSWMVARRNPAAYDSDGRYHKEWENLTQEDIDREWEKLKAKNN